MRKSSLYYGLAFCLFFCKVSLAENVKILLYAGAIDSQNDVLLTEATKQLEEMLTSSSAVGTAEVSIHKNIGTLVTGFYSDSNQDRASRTIFDESFDYVIFVESSDLHNTPEYYFEGVHQLSNLAKKAGAVPMLITPLSESPVLEKFKEISYRIANGCDIGLVPTASVFKAVEGDYLSPNLQAYLFAASIYSTITHGAVPTTSIPGSVQSLLADSPYLNDELFRGLTREQSKVQYRDSFINLGLVHIRHLNLSQGSDFRYLRTGTSTESGIQPLLNNLITASGFNPIPTVLPNDDNFRAFELLDFNLSKPHFESNPNTYYLVYARRADIRSSTLRAYQQSNLSCLVFDKHIQGKTAKELASRVYHGGEDGEATTALALENNWSWTPFHIAAGRLLEEIPDIVATTDGVHLTSPYLYMIASMFYTSSTGLKPEVPQSERNNVQVVTAIDIGYELISQLAQLSEFGPLASDDVNRILNIDEGLTNYWANHNALGWLNTQHYPWVFHQHHSWLYSESSGNGEYWFYNLALEDWTWTSDENYPWLWSNNRQSWLYFSPSETNYYYDSKSRTWLTLEELNRD